MKFPLGLIETLNKLNPKKFSLICGGLFFFGIIYGWIMFPLLFKTLLKSQVQLKPGAKMRLMWETIPFYLEFKIYLFNITNPEEVIIGGKPKIKEIGPYFFEEWKKKEQIVDNDKEDTTEFYAKDTFIFRPDLSNGLTGQEKITLYDPLLVGMALVVKKDRAPMLPLVAKAISEIFKKNTPFLTEPAMDILYHGVLIDCSSQDFAAKSVCTVLSNEVKGVIAFNETHHKFSLLGSSNATLFNKYKVFRGMKNVKDIGRVIEFNDETELNVFADDECNVLRGTDGTIFPPMLEREEGITAFVPALCHDVTTKYQKPGKYAGMPVDRYILDFGDPKNDEKLQCFCQDPPDDCPPKGVWDLFACWEAPFYVSLPHFLNSDPELINAVDGLSPNPEYHETAILFERTSGTPLSATNRLQFSMSVDNVEEVDVMRNLTNRIMPILWVEEGLSLNKTFSNMLKYQLFIPTKLSNFFKWSCVVLGLLGSIGFGYLTYKRANEKPVTPVEPVKENTSELQSAASNIIRTLGTEQARNEISITHGK